jgi:hypothetical protein
MCHNFHHVEPFLADILSGGGTGGFRPWLYRPSNRRASSSVKHPRMICMALLSLLLPAPCSIISSQASKIFDNGGTACASGCKDLVRPQSAFLCVERTARLPRRKSSQIDRPVSGLSWSGEAPRSRSKRSIDKSISYVQQNSDPESLLIEMPLLSARHRSGVPLDPSNFSEHSLTFLST